MLPDGVFAEGPGRLPNGAIVDDVGWLAEGSGRLSAVAFAEGLG
jgi:hypothetical protein